MRALWRSVFRARALLCWALHSILLASTAFSAQQEIIPEVPPGATPMWRSTEVAARGTTVPVSIGSASAELARISEMLLANGYPCAAISLMRLNRDWAERAQQRHVYSGIPSARTLPLIAGHGDSAQFEQSFQRLWGGPYEASGGIFIAVTITTQRAGHDYFISSTHAEMVDAEDRPIDSKTTIEAPVRFLWARQSGELLGVYR